MEHDDKYADAFDVIDLTQEAEIKAKGAIRWTDRKARIAFFKRLAENIADHASFYKKPGCSKTQPLSRRLRDDIQHLYRKYGKMQVVNELKAFGFTHRDDSQPQ
jgi:hypothetical protein